MKLFSRIAATVALTVASFSMFACQSTCCPTSKAACCAKENCCDAAAKAGKACEQKCCVDAAKAGTACKMCPKA